jgi:hypothetical protein
VLVTSAPGTDKCGSLEEDETYSKLFELVGFLLRLDLTDRDADL